MSPGDVPPTPQPTGRNGRAPLGTVTHSPHQLRKGGNRPGTALARPLSLGDPNQHPLPPQTRYLPTSTPPWITVPDSLRREERLQFACQPRHAPCCLRSPGPWLRGPVLAYATAVQRVRHPTKLIRQFHVVQKTKVLPGFFPVSASHRCHQCSVFSSRADDAETATKTRR